MWWQNKKTRVTSTHLYENRTGGVLVVQAGDAPLVTLASGDHIEITFVGQASGHARFHDSGLEVLARRGHDHLEKVTREEWVQQGLTRVR